MSLRSFFNRKNTADRLVKAVKNGDVKTVKGLLQQSAEAEVAEVIRAILVWKMTMDGGIDADTKDKYGADPEKNQGNAEELKNQISRMYTAAKSGDVKTVNEILEHIADHSPKTKPLEIARTTPPFPPAPRKTEPKTYP